MLRLVYASFVCRTLSTSYPGVAWRQIRTIDGLDNESHISSDPRLQALLEDMKAYLDSMWARVQGGEVQIATRRPPTSFPNLSRQPIL